MVNGAHEEDREDLLIVLQHVEQVESRMEQLYRWFGSLFVDDAEAGDLFDRLAREEHEHASLVQLQIRIVRRSRKEFGDIRLKLGAIEEMVRLIDHVSKAAPPTLRHAVGYAIGLESSSAEHYHRVIITESKPELSTMMKALTRGFETHHRVLEDFARKKGFEFV